MRRNRELRRGDIYWLDNCPPLQGDVAKRRPVIVINPPDRTTGEVVVLIVATSTTVLPSETDRIALPNLEDEPQTKARFPKRCWAVPRWYVTIQPQMLHDYIGYVSEKLQRQILDAVVKWMEEAKRKEPGARGAPGS